jgi:hypothetical protein
MGNYNLFSTKISTQTKKSTLSSKIIKAEVHGHFQDGALAFFEIQVRARKWAIIDLFR